MSFLKSLQRLCWNRAFDLTRVSLHFIVGILIVSSYFLTPVLPPTLAAMFVVYELDEARHLRDHAFLDIAGANAGAWATVVGLLLWRWLA